MKNIRKNLKVYSKEFEEIDNTKKSSANRAVVEARRRMLEEWVAWRQQTEERLVEERREAGLNDLSEEREALLVHEEDGEGGEGAEGKLVEEIFEEILEESEEVVE